MYDNSIENIERHGYPKPLKWITLDCGCEAHEGDLVYEVGNEKFCEEHFIDEITESLHKDPEMFAIKHNYEVERVEIQ